MNVSVEISFHNLCEHMLLPPWTDRLQVSGLPPEGSRGQQCSHRRRRFFHALQFSSWVMHHLRVTIFGEFTWILVKMGKALIWQYIFSTLQQYGQFEPPPRAFLWGGRAPETRVCQTVEARGGERRENQTVQSGGSCPALSLPKHPLTSVTYARRTTGSSSTSARWWRQQHERRLAL